MPSRIIQGDCRAVLPTLDAESVQCVVTSPPYFGLRDYGVDGQIGLEPTPDAYVAELVTVFREVRRVLKSDGTLWLNLGDSYCSTAPGTRNAPQTKGSPTAPEQWANMRPKTPPGLKPKDLMGIPWRVAFALQADGWYLRSDVIWEKPNAMPESVTDRPTKAHEYLFLLTKSERYSYDAEAIKEPANGLGTTRNRRSVWSVPTRPFKGAHFAVMPPALVEPCIRAGSCVGDAVLDPFAGAGTTNLVAHGLGRHGIGIELNPTYFELAKERIYNDAPIFCDGDTVHA